VLSDELKAQIRDSFIALKSDMSDFSVRPSQNKMIAEISKTLCGDYPDSNKILCVEAPTGTGKTFAYLLSSIPIAKDNKKKLIVSSANVALQEQLLLKDIPEAQKYCTVDFEYALVKGRSRYVCIRNLINLCEDSTADNTLFDANLLFDEPPAKYQLEEMGELLEDYSAKKWNGEIDDLMANHDLVLADLATGNTVLPDVDDSIFVFDEAHHLSAKALSHFSLNTSTEYIKTSIRQTKSVSDQICKITEQDAPDMNIKQIDDYLSDLITLLKTLDFDEDIYLFDQGMVDQPIKDIGKNLFIMLSSIQDKFCTIRESWSDYLKIKVLDKGVTDSINTASGECEQHLSSILELLSSFLKSDDSHQSPHSRWIEKNTLANKKTNYSLFSAQTDISNNLEALIWSKAFGVILTSATLSSLGSFDRLNKQLGLKKVENQYLRLPSPFKFEQVNFIIAKFKTNPTQVYDHTQEVASQLLKRINTQKGTLVLFASNKQMQIVADMVEKKLDCTLFTQGEYPKKTILEKHTYLRKQGQGSIIFGLDSFAEGVDLKGDNLTHVVIVKLRFSVPTSPIDKTLADYLQSQNRNPFMEISLPDASLRLIQACGRLIRTETDTGKITIFDNRLTTKFYGKQLLAALPNYNIVVE